VQVLLVAVKDPVAVLLDKRLGTTVQDHSIFTALTQQYEREFHDDMKALNVRPFALSMSRASARVCVCVCVCLFLCFPQARYQQVCAVLCACLFIISSRAGLPSPPCRCAHPTF
jgi:hypothetical protein